jgi:hypothetical protein
MTTNTSGMVGGAFEHCPAMEDDRYENNDIYVVMREGVVELASRDADASLLSAFEADWRRTGDGFEIPTTDFQDVPAWLPAADQQNFAAYMQFMEAILLERFPNDQAIAACKADYVALACLAAAVAKPMMAGDALTASIVGNTFKQTGQLPECRPGVATDVAYQGLAGAYTGAIANVCPSGQVLDPASGKCVPQGSQPVVAKDEAKSAWPGWTLPAIGVGAVVLGGIALIAIANPTPTCHANPGRARINDAERETWVDNDEGLYDMWRRSRQSKRAFIRENREMIDHVIGNVASGAHRQHYLKYGG